MKALKVTSIGLMILLLGIQFIPSKREENKGVPKTDFMLVNDVPYNIKNKLQVSCYDCHSDNTNYPWYSKVQPITWFLEDHIEEGKAELNFNEWDSLSNRRKKSKLRSIIKQIESGEMPLDSYTFIHGDATFSDSEKQEITKWMKQLKDSI